MSSFALSAQNQPSLDTTKNIVDRRIAQSQTLLYAGYVDSAMLLLTQTEAAFVETLSKAQQAKLKSKIGVIHQVRGDYNNALNLQLKALPLAEASGNQTLTSEVLNNIGAIHHSQKNYDDALSYYNACLQLRENLGDKRELALSYNNFGSLYEEMGRLDEAKENLSRSLAYWEQLGDSSWIAVAYTNLGSMMESQGQLDSALTLYRQSLSIFEALKTGSQKGNVMAYIGNIMLLKNKPAQARKWCNQALLIGEEWASAPLIMKSCECLHQAAELLDKPIEAFAYFKRYILYRDSLSSRDLTRELTKLEMDYSFKKQMFADSLQAAKERIKTEFEFNQRITKQRNQRNIFMLIGLGILLLAAGLYSRLQFIRRTKEKIQAERDRSDGLLLNILPASVAEELKEKGEAQAREYQEVSVLFTDFVAFTKHSERLSASELLIELNTYFGQFDQLSKAYGLEKIKTIGDAYMVAGGLPIASKEAVRNTILAAIDMQAFMTSQALERAQKGEQAFEMRLGIHTGTIVAGIVGKVKFQYDIWGDTVNTASRMESASVPGKVNISESTYHLVKNDPTFQFESRGKIEVKGKGELEMYFVERR